MFVCCSVAEQVKAAVAPSQNPGLLSLEEYVLGLLLSCCVSDCGRAVRHQLLPPFLRLANRRQRRCHCRQPLRLVPLCDCVLWAAGCLRPFTAWSAKPSSAATATRSSTRATEQRTGEGNFKVKLRERIMSDLKNKVNKNTSRPFRPSL